MGPKKKVSEQKKCRKILSIEQKKEIIAKHNEGVKVMQLARIYKTSHSTISSILAKKEKIMVAKVAKGTSRLNVRGHIFEEMENLLLIWIKEREMAGDTTSKNAICHKAKQIYKDLKKTSGSSYEEDEDFKGSRGWFDNFKKRAGIHSVVRHREAASADKEAADKFIDSFAKIIDEGQYLPQQIFNCAETGLFWKKMPSRTYITKEESKLPIHKPMNDRLTLLLAANASGDCKVKPMLIYHCDDPRAFEKFSVSKSSLGVFCKSNSKAWVTRIEFKDWIHKVFGPTVKAYFEQNNLPLKAILTLYNTPGHPTDVQEQLADQLDFIKVIFLPPNTTSLIQPMNHLVIANFKKLYTKALFTKCFEMCNATNMTLKKFWEEKLNIVIAIRLIVEAWEKVTATCLKAAWRKLCPSFDYEDTSDEGHKLIKDIVATARDPKLEVEEEVVEKLLDMHDRELTIDELQELFKEQCEEKEMEILPQEDEQKNEITTTEIKTVLAKCEQVQNVAMKWNPNKDEVMRTANLFNEKSMQFFRNILKKRQKQATLDTIFTGTLVKKLRSEPNCLHVED